LTSEGLLDKQFANDSKTESDKPSSLMVMLANLENQKKITISDIFPISYLLAERRLRFQIFKMQQKNPS